MLNIYLIKRVSPSCIVFNLGIKIYFKKFDYFIIISGPITAFGKTVEIQGM